MKQKTECKRGHTKTGVRYRKDKRLLELFCDECQRMHNREYARRRRQKVKLERAA